MLSQVVVKDAGGTKEDVCIGEPRGTENDGLGRRSREQSASCSETTKSLVATAHGILELLITSDLCGSHVFALSVQENVLVSPFPTFFWEREGQIPCLFSP